MMVRLVISKSAEAEFDSGAYLDGDAFLDALLERYDG